MFVSKLVRGPNGANWTMRRLALRIPRFLDWRQLEAFWRVRPFTAARRVELGENVDIEGRVWIPGKGRVQIGRGVRLRGRRAPIELRAHEGAEIRLGDGVVIESGASIEATELVEIGARASIGAFSKIIDNNYHQTVGNRDERPPPVAIHVGEDAAIGPRAILLPGARVGARAVVAAGQVLSCRHEAAPSSRHDARRTA